MPFAGAATPADATCAAASRATTACVATLRDVVTRAVTASGWSQRSSRKMWPSLKRLATGSSSRAMRTMRPRPSARGRSRIPAMPQWNDGRGIPHVGNAPSAWLSRRTRGVSAGHRRFRSSAATATADYLSSTTLCVRSSSPIAVPGLPPERAACKSAALCSDRGRRVHPVEVKRAASIHPQLHRRFSALQRLPVPTTRSPPESEHADLVLLPTLPPIHVRTATHRSSSRCRSSRGVDRSLSPCRRESGTSAR